MQEVKRVCESEPDWSEVSKGVGRFAQMSEGVGGIGQNYFRSREKEIKNTILFFPLVETVGCIVVCNKTHIQVAGQV